MSQKFPGPGIGDPGLAAKLKRYSCAIEEPEPGVIVIQKLNGNARLAMERATRWQTRQNNNRSREWVLEATLASAIAHLMQKANLEPGPAGPRRTVRAEPLAWTNNAWRLEITDPAARRLWNGAGLTARGHESFVSDAIRLIFLVLDVGSGQRGPLRRKRSERGGNRRRARRK